MATLPDSIKQRIQARAGHGGGEWNGGGGNGAGQSGGRIRDFSPGAFARLWVKQGGDTLRPVRVQLGLSDGSFTEVSGDIKPGDEIIMGIIATDATPAPTTSPGAPGATPPNMRRF